jgi:hypothetical protein
MHHPTRAGPEPPDIVLISPPPYTTIPAKEDMIRGPKIVKVRVAETHDVAVGGYSRGTADLTAPRQ